MCMRIVWKRECEFDHVHEHVHVHVHAHVHVHVHVHVHAQACIGLQAALEVHRVINR
jgi:hypothetical protein